MLNALLGAEVENVTAVVTRYFGGIKLGAGGLVRAYGGAVTQALAAMPRVMAETRPVWALTLPYAAVGRIQEELMRQGAVILDLAYGTATDLRFTYSGDAPDLVARLTQGTLQPEPAGQHLVEVALAPALPQPGPVSS